MDEHLPPAQRDRGSSERFVRHVTQAHPNDLVDPWWNVRHPDALLPRLTGTTSGNKQPLMKGVISVTW